MARQNILVIKLGALGDFIQALGPMAAIRNYHKDDHITLLTTKPYELIGQKCPYFNEIIVDKKPSWFDIPGWMNLRHLLNEKKFWRVYDLQNNDRTGFYFRLFSKRPEWVGIAKGASHQNTSPVRTSGHAFTGHKQTLSLAGIDHVEIDNLSWMKGSKDLSDFKKPYVLIVPGGSPQHPEKRWPAQLYSELCNKLLSKNITPVLLGGKSEADVIAEIKRNAPGCVDLTSQTDLFDIAALARNAIASIGNDTGPMHLIGPTGCRTIVLFSNKSNPVRHAPLGANIHTLQKENLADLDVLVVWDLLKDQLGL